MTSEKLFSTKEAAILINTTTSRLSSQCVANRWGKWIQPQNDARGQGYPKLWTSRDIVIMRMLNDLSEKSVALNFLIDILVPELKSCSWGTKTISAKRGSLEIKYKPSWKGLIK